MRGHTNRSAYYVLGEGVVRDLPNLFGEVGCPFAGTKANNNLPGIAPFRFGRMFGKSSVEPDSKEFKDLFAAMIDLGLCLNDPQTHGHKPLPPPPDKSNIPAGYTYLGQFIAH